MLIYALPHLYEWSMKNLHGQNLDRRFKKIADIIGDGSVLDLACGTGLLADYLSPHAKYQGIDLNKRFLKFSRNKGLAVFEQNVFDIHDYPEADTYVICDLLHHIMPRHQSLLEAVLALGKNVIVCEPPVPSKSKFRRMLIRGFLDHDLINPPRLDLSWFTEPELLAFFERVMQPTELLKIGNDIIAIRQMDA